MKSAAAQDFGQESEHTCGVACRQYVLSHYGFNRTKKQLLLEGIEENEDGNTAAELVKAACKLGFVARVRCLFGYGHLAGEVPRARLQEGSEEELLKWLTEVLKHHKPVIVSLDTRQLTAPYDSKRGGPHSVVLIKIQGDKVQFFEPDPPEQNGPRPLLRSLDHRRKSPTRRRPMGHPDRLFHHRQHRRPIPEDFRPRPRGYPDGGSAALAASTAGGAAR